ncbi:peptidoglycan DD-metalloendopeptidase family protein [Thalassotalea sp. LPB0316]|uniref:peptidoglycan DD-metalloendopeptidase family protein n=1 Tax=Thalassotalea sp. LPB0316 TaxID=2769490 RepID=UPI001D045792|nr:peptidoglycan DD-metalloendopeptidase family protein [Thalassotalea sp. LPB0316]
MKNIKNLYLSLPKLHRWSLKAGVFILISLTLLPSENQQTANQSKQNNLEVGKRYELAIPFTDEPSGAAIAPISPAPVTSTETANQDEDAQTTAEVLIDEPTISWQTATVKSGDSLAKILNRHGFSAQTTYNITKTKHDDINLLKKLQVGDTLNIGTDDTNTLVALDYPISRVKTLRIVGDGKDYQADIEEKVIETRQAIAHGVIKTSFWHAGVNAGLTDNQIINLANVFSWDIDFALDIRKNDEFHVIYENQYVDGEFIGHGAILAAEFVNQNEEFRAIRFTDGEYYTPEGRSMRKAFLRAPVNFKYISSNFKPKRFHPIQKRWKAHNGTDYRAAKGTPVVAAGNGKVTHSTYNKYNGNYVFIQHGSGIVTKYLHFSKRAVKKGQRVKQGQVIGYVGSTGMSEAPHLHYEFLVNGVHRNPRTVKLPDAEPIAKQHKQAFNLLAQQRIQELSGSKQALLAMQVADED